MPFPEFTPTVPVLIRTLAARHADRTLIVLGEGGNLALVDASPDGFVQRATAQILAGKNWTAPSLAGGKLYLRNHEELVCIDLQESSSGGRSAGAGD